MLFYCLGLLSVQKFILDSTDLIGETRNQYLKITIWKITIWKIVIFHVIAKSEIEQVFESKNGIPKNKKPVQENLGRESIAEIKF